MDAITLYKLMKPHLALLTPSEKEFLSKMITTSQPEKITSHHRKIRSLTKAKEHLKQFCLNEIEKERKEHSIV